MESSDYDFNYLDITIIGFGEYECNTRWYKKNETLIRCEK